jgi:hypothetical protein
MTPTSTLPNRGIIWVTVTILHCRVNVFAPSPATDAELAADSVYQFILHHPTTPYTKGQGAVGSLTRWRGGRPETTGGSAAVLPESRGEKAFDRESTKLVARSQ